MKDSTKRNRCPGKRSRKSALLRAREAKHAVQTAPSTPTSTLTSTTTEENDIALHESASKRKLALNCIDQPEVTPEQHPQYAIVDINRLAILIAQVSCPTCSGSMTLSTSTQRGFALKAEISCRVCSDDPPNSVMTSSTLTDSGHFDINRRMVASFLNFGNGYTALSSFCEGLGMPVMSEKTFSSHMKVIASTCGNLGASFLESAVDKVRQHHGVSDRDVLDVAVCFDGSWHKRGHTSKHGFASVIEIETGLVVDYHVLTSYCHECHTVGYQRRQAGNAVYQAWYDAHLPDCKVNHEGTAGMMEVAAAEVMWGRSMERLLRYTTLISDGDSKTFDALTRLQPYGVHVNISKEECTNHVAKRLGTNLRMLCSNEAKRGTTLGGKKQGSLTQTKINKLQGYYKSAVSSRCQSPEELRGKIMATFHHAASTDDHPNHTYCPKGPESWCFYNCATALGMVPPSHAGQCSVELSPEVAKYVRPVYERLTSDELLGRCLRGLTQNTNESIHSVIWGKCPKHLFVGFDRVQIAATLGVGQFNSGSLAFRKFLRSIGLVIISTSVSLGERRDAKRIISAERKETLEVKRRRKERALASSSAQKELLRNEGGASYSSGAF